MSASSFNRTALPAGFNTNYDAWQVDQGIVQVNAMKDTRTYSLRTKRATNSGTLTSGTILHPSNATIGSEHTKLYNFEVGYVNVALAKYGMGGRFDASGTRSSVSQETRVPVVDTFNDETGTPEELEERFWPFGILTNTGRLSGEVGANARIGGFFTILNNSWLSWRINDYIRAKITTPDEARQLRAANGNAANTQGRAPAALVPFRPEETNFLNATSMINALAKCYKLTTTTADQYVLTPVPDAVRHRATTTSAFVSGAFHLTEALAQHAVLVQLATEKTPADIKDVDEADLNERLGRARAITAYALVMGPGTSPTNLNMADRVLARSTGDSGTILPNSAIASYRKMADSAMATHNLLKKNPTHASIVAQSVLKNVIERTVLGITRNSAEAGKLADFQLRGYSR